MPIRFLIVLAVAVSCARCAADSPTHPSTPLPTKGAPARVELNAVVATGANGGTAQVTARVLDAFANLVVGAPVEFSASAGTFSEASTMTSDKGVASTILTADPGTVTITAKVASVQTQTTVSVQPRVVTPTPGPNPPPSPLPAPPGPPSSPGPFTVTVFASAVQVGTATSFTATVGGSTAPVRATWDFGDGATLAGSTMGNQASVSHTYATIGSFHTTVVVTDAAGHSGSASTDAQVTAAPPPPPPPPASFTVALAASPATVGATVPTTLTATVTKVNTTLTANTFVWDCGDGSPTTTTAVNTNPCTYATSGIFTARVTASNGSVTGSGSTAVAVTPAPMLVSIATATPAPAIGVPVTFTGTVTSAGIVPATALTWEWDFDNSATSTFTVIESGTSPHSTTFAGYGSSGVKTVKVRVTDPVSGRTAIGTRTVTVP